MSFASLFRKKILQTFVGAFLLDFGIGSVNTLDSIILNNIKEHRIPLAIYGTADSFLWLNWRGTAVFS